MTYKTLSLAIVCALGISGTTAHADSEVIETAYIEDIGAQERINFSGKLRMLSQRIPSAACHLVEGTQTDKASAILAGATAEFEKILNALEFGDPDLKIKGEEQRRKTLVKMHDLREKWAPVKAAALAMADGDVSEGNLDVILSDNMGVLGAAKLLVSELVGQYSDPTAMLQADSLLIDIAGRQRMLTQKMSKETCMLASHHAKPDTVEQLQGTMQMFEVSLMALRNGLPEAGIKAAPNAEIEGGLDVVIADWNKVKPTLETLIGGTDISAEEEATKFVSLNTMLFNMNQVVGMYTEATKLGL